MTTPEIGYFISDLHLNSVEEPNAIVLLNFLRAFDSSDQISHLFLLGDIFDLWIAGHGYFRRRFAPIIEELVRLRDLGVEIHYLEGNHDLYLEHFFAHGIKLNVHRGPILFAFQGLTLRMEHGDEMNSKDYGYQFLRWFLRTPLMEWIVPRSPEPLVVWLGHRMSRVSRKHTSESKAISDDRARGLIRRHAEAVWGLLPFDIILSGHVHVVEDSIFTPPGASAPVRVVNLGAWFDEPRTFVMSPGFVGFRRV